MRIKPGATLLLGILILTVLLTLAASLAPGRAQVAAQVAGQTATPTGTPNHFLPFIQREATPTPSPTVTPTSTPTPTITTTPKPLDASIFCSVPVIPIDPNGAITDDTQTISTAGKIVDLDVYIQADHEWVGDLTFTLVHDNTNTSVVLIDQPGAPANQFGCPSDNIYAVLDDDAADPVEDECAASAPAIQGRFSPNEALADFNNESLNGSWTMEVVDSAPADLGTFNVWCMLAVYQP